jgi:tetratricopeptide (TPR) repeat protein
MRYARFLRRNGRLDRASEINEDVVNSTALSRDSTTRALAAEALANMGVIARKQGKLLDSKQRLVEATRLGRSAGVAGAGILTYSLDNLAWTQLRLGDTNEALSNFQDSLAVRQSTGDTRGAALSGINLARTKLRLGDAEGTIDALRDALDVLDESVEAASYANALALRGEALLVEGDHSAAKEDLRRALDINERIGNSDGISVVSSLLARAALANMDYAAATRYAERSRLESERSANREGLVVAHRLLGQIDGKDERWAASVEHHTVSTRFAREIGDPAREAAALLDLADALDHNGKPAEAQLARERAGRLQAASSEVSSVAGPKATTAESIEGSATGGT